MEQRTIRFRAWNPAKMRMSAPYDPLGNGYLNGTRPTFWPKNMVFMQFTGLHDKNGKDIYEGDIVRAQTWEGRASDAKRIKGVVAYAGSGFILVDGKDNGMRQSGDDYGETCSLDCSTEESLEVIGNIYENP